VALMRTKPSAQPWPMLHLTCSLRFADGETVVAKVSARSKIEDASVVYSGAVERLPVCPDLATVVELRAYFASFARELRAGLTEDLREDRVALSPEVDKLLDSLRGMAAKPHSSHRQSALRA
jgi:hypothetical protein